MLQRRNLLLLHSYNEEALVARHLSQKEAIVMIIVIPTLTGEQGKPVKIFPDGSHINCFCHSFIMYDDYRLRQEKRIYSLNQQLPIGQADG